MYDICSFSRKYALFIPNEKIERSCLTKVELELKLRITLEMLPILHSVVHKMTRDVALKLSIV